MNKLILLLTLLLPALCPAQSYTVDWSKIAGGGGLSPVSLIKSPAPSGSRKPAAR